MKSLKASRILSAGLANHDLTAPLQIANTSHSVRQGTNLTRSWHKVLAIPRAAAADSGLADLCEVTDVECFENATVRDGRGQSFGYQ